MKFCAGSTLVLCVVAVMQAEAGTVNISRQVLANSYVNIAQRYNMVGSWSGSADCTIVFYKDDGQNVAGNCNNEGVSHHFEGTYTSSDTIQLIITRTDSNNCVI